MEEETWLANTNATDKNDGTYLVDDRNARTGQGLSDASILSSITLALASTGEHLTGRLGELDAGVSESGTLGTHPRIDAIRTDEAPEASSSTDGAVADMPASPAKRGRGRPKGSLDRNPRARRDGKAAGTGNTSASEDMIVVKPAARIQPAEDSQGSPVVKRKPGRPRKERPTKAPVPRAPKPNITESAPAKPSAFSRSTPTTAPLITPERKEANRRAALRSRLRKVERASILEKMAAGLTEENVALKERIQALTLLGLDERSLKERPDETSNLWVQTGYTVDNPEAVSSPRPIDESQAGSVPPAGPRSSEIISSPVVDRSAAQDLPLRALLPDASNTLQADVERRLQYQIDRLRAALEKDGNAGFNLPVASGPSGSNEDTKLLKDVAARLRRENKKAAQVLRERRDELLLLNQTGLSTRSVDANENSAGSSPAKELALKRHAEVESALVDMKRHLGQLMTVSDESRLVWDVRVANNESD